MPFTGVYSTQLLSLGDIAEGIAFSGYVPSGTIWIVRDILCVPPATSPDTPLNGIEVFQSLSGARMARWVFPYVVSNTEYHRVCRQVMNEGDSIGVEAHESGWSCCISGYQLGTVG